MGVANDLPGLRPISDLVNFTSGGCGFGSSNTRGDAESLLEIKVWLGDRQVVSGTPLKLIRWTTWRKTISIDTWGALVSVDGDRVCGAASTAGLIPTDVPGTAKAALSELTRTSMSEGGESSHWCGAVDDPHKASEVSGEDEGWTIQSVIENAEVDALRSAPSSSGAGGYCKRGVPAGDRAFKVEGLGESKNGDWSSRMGSTESST
jgi:hypothetical protein